MLKLQPHAVYLCLLVVQVRRALQASLRTLLRGVAMKAIADVEKELGADVRRWCCSCSFLHLHCHVRRIQDLTSWILLTDLPGIPTVVCLRHHIHPD